jgi:FdhD protein
MVTPTTSTAGATRRNTAEVQVDAIRDGRRLVLPDRLATEEPMEIRAHGPGQEPVSIAVTMRTPGHDFELATGFLVTEGLAPSRATVSEVRYCDLPDGGEQQYNIVTVTLRRPFERQPDDRGFVAAAGCGICGKETLDQVALSCPVVTSDVTVPTAIILSLPDRLREGQAVFERTGGLHAAGLFANDGAPVVVREDIGRHNAVDKVVGWGALNDRLPFGDHVLMVSGRPGFEIVQKAAMAGIPIVAAVSAPSSLAVDAARRLGVTLVGFVRGANANIYSRPERIAGP